MSLEMKYINKDISEDIQGCFILLGSQIIFSFFLLLFLVTTFMGKYSYIDYIWLFVADTILLLVTYFQIRAIKNAVFYFLPFERYTVDGGKLFYEKRIKLFRMEYRIEKFDFLLDEIKSVSFLPARRFTYASNRWISPVWFLYYFKVHQRICVKLINGREYRVCNYVKAPNGFDIFADNSQNEEYFMLIFQEFKEFIEKGREETVFQHRLKEWEEAYENPKKERYQCILTQILKEEKVFLIRTEDSFIVNSGKEAIYHLEIFKGVEFEEMDFYKFYLDYLSNKDYENTVVRVADNGRDYKELSMKQLKEDINKLRDET